MMSALSEGGHQPVSLRCAPLESASKRAGWLSSRHLVDLFGLSHGPERMNALVFPRQRASTSLPAGWWIPAVFRPCSSAWPESCTQTWARCR